MKTATGLTIKQDGKEIIVTSDKTIKDNNFENKIGMNQEEVVNRMERVINILGTILLALVAGILITFVFKLLI